MPVSNPSPVMVGATALVAGAQGDVPAPAAGQQALFLRGDATWQSAGGGGTPGGNDTEVQFNDAGAFGGSPDVLLIDSGGGWKQLVVTSDAAVGSGQLQAESHNDAPGGAWILGQSSKGTRASPTALTGPGDPIGILRFDGYVGATNTYRPGFILEVDTGAVVDDLPPSGHLQSQMTLTLGNASGNIETAMTLTPALATFPAALDVGGELDHDGSTAGFFGAIPVAQQGPLTDITDLTGGTPSNPIPDTPNAYDETYFADALAQIIASINAINVALRNLGLST